MPSLQIRGLPAPVLEALKRRARRHHRSLQKELHSILEEAARAAPAAEDLEPLSLHMSSSTSTTPWTREDLYDDRGR